MRRRRARIHPLLSRPPYCSPEPGFRLPISLPRILQRVRCVMTNCGRHRYFVLKYDQVPVAGHPSYDLAHVLENALRNVATKIERTMLARYRSMTVYFTDFESAYWALPAQRNTRILGFSSRLWKRVVK